MNRGQAARLVRRRNSAAEAGARQPWLPTSVPSRSARRVSMTGVSGWFSASARSPDGRVWHEAAEREGRNRTKNEKTGDRSQGEVEHEWRQTLASLIDPARFPEVSTALAAAAFEADGADSEGDPDLEFGLMCILEGVARLAEHPTGAAR